MRTAFLLIFSSLFLQISVFSQKAEREKGADTRIDNNKYWKMMAAEGKATLNPVRNVEPATFTGSKIRAFSVAREDSPDVPVTLENSTQSENSVFVDPNNNLTILNSNNSTENPVGDLYGANDLYSFDGGVVWDGELEGAGGTNSGDPAAAIDLDGRWYVGYISESLGQGVSYSDDQGQTWTKKNVASGGGGILDKNHLWLDNSTVSPYAGNLYIAWTDFTGGSNDSEIMLARSTDHGETWQSATNISSEVNAGSHNQGVNIQTGPDGEVYAVWAIYDGWPTDESALGFAKSTDGGQTFTTAQRIIDDIRGIRNSGVGKNQRTASFPVMAVDISQRQYNGNIYIVWTNIGVPGINSGTDADVYLIRSEDGGDTWSDPIRVNQDPAGVGSVHYYPWITCDPENGILSVVFYDDRNVGGTKCETWVANSYDAGDTWEDFKVSDVNFTPSPIPGLADGYMGDYLGISARGGYVYPVWADNRNGTVLSYCSPFETNALPRPKDLLAEVTFETGVAQLTWTFDAPRDFTNFNIYRDEVLIGTATDTTYSDELPDYGIFKYQVTAVFDPDGESSAASAMLQWGDAQISVTPESIEVTVMQDSSKTEYITINNIGQLLLNYHITPFIPDSPADDTRAYCSASGGCDEYISHVQFGTINKTSGCTGYGNYSNLSTLMMAGQPYDITITNGTPLYSGDEVGIWIDWDQNEVFEEDESVVVNGSPGIGPYTATIIPPHSALAGETRLRIRMTWQETPDPCGTTTYGEVEDYSIDVINWLQLNTYNGEIPRDESAEIEVMFNAQGLELGDYTADLEISSNDPDDPMVTIPLMMHVVTMGVEVMASAEEICHGETVNITSELIAPTGSYTYSWTSIPEGFTSSDTNVTVTPDTTTTYLLQVTDGIVNVFDEITITVHPLPELALGDNIDLCAGDSTILDAGVDHHSYLWNTGDTTQMITVKETGVYSVTVATEFGCESTDTIDVAFHEFPSVSLGQDTTLCYYHQIMMDAGNEGATYEWSTGETSQTIIVDTTGMIADQKEIWVNVTNIFGCASSDTMLIQFNQCASVPESSLNTMKVYPNPSYGLFIVELNSLRETTAELTLADGAGIIVYRETYELYNGSNKIKLSLGHLAEGVYTLKLNHDKTSSATKLIIKR